MKRTRAWPVHVGFAVASLASGVGSAQSLEDSLSACTSVADEKRRLACYDDHMTRAGKKIAVPGTVTHAPASASAPSAATPPAPASASTPTAAPSLPRLLHPRPRPEGRHAATPSTSGEFGLEGEALRKKRAAETGEDASQSEEMTARVTSVSERARGEHRIELENGQVWEETQRTGGHASCGRRNGDDQARRDGLVLSHTQDRARPAREAHQMKKGGCCHPPRRSALLQKFTLAPM